MADNTKLIAFIVAAGTLGAGAFMLAKMILKKNIIVQYSAEADKPYAVAIAKAINATQIISGNVDISTITQPMVCVGGQSVNTTFANLVNAGKFRNLTEADAGKGIIQVSSFNNVPVYGVAGYHKADTEKAANWIIQNKTLPTRSIVIG